MSTVAVGRRLEVATGGAEVTTGSTEKIGVTVFDSVTGAGFELLIWQQGPGASDDFISMPSWPIFVLAIIGHSGGQCLEMVLSGTHIAIDSNGSRTMAARTLVETNLCQKRMIYLYAQFYRAAVTDITTTRATSLVSDLNCADSLPLLSIMMAIFRLTLRETLERFQIMNRTNIRSNKLPSSIGICFLSFGCCS